jgi:hypothetical protein
VFDVAALLAAHGYPALSLAYFGQPGLPSRLCASRSSTSRAPSACCGARRASIPHASS